MIVGVGSCWFLLLVFDVVVAAVAVAVVVGVVLVLLRKNGETPKLVVDFLKENTFRNKIMEIVEDFFEKK